MGRILPAGCNNEVLGGYNFVLVLCLTVTPIQTDQSHPDQSHQTALFTYKVTLNEQHFIADSSNKSHLMMLNPAVHALTPDIKKKREHIPFDTSCLAD